MKKSLSKSTLSFLADLIQNNTREWFGVNKVRYDAAREEFIQFLDSLISDVSSFEPFIADQKGKDLIFRIYRDVRFSKNKNPYKDHFGAYLAEGGRKSVNPGYYLHIAANNQSFIACGLWMPPANLLKAARQEIDYNFAEFERILKAPEFTNYFGSLSGEKLKTTPKGYHPENLAIDYLRHKSWMVSRPLPDNVVTSDALFDNCLKAIALAKPMKDFFMRSIEDVSKAEN